LGKIFTVTLGRQYITFFLIGHFLEIAASICLLDCTKPGLLLEHLNPQQVCNNLQARLMEVVIMVYV